MAYPTNPASEYLTDIFKRSSNFPECQEYLDTNQYVRFAIETCMTYDEEESGFFRHAYDLEQTTGDTEQINQITGYPGEGGCPKFLNPRPLTTATLY